MCTRVAIIISVEISKPMSNSSSLMATKAHAGLTFVTTLEELTRKSKELGKTLGGEWHFAYVRISDKDKQEAGTSLEEQPRVIADYARSKGITIGICVVETQSASKLGRPLFLEMLSLLKRMRAKGAIFHKIDRSARNMKEWGELEVLLDLGIEVHSAADGIDLSTRPGRIMANILASMAADYSRNLRSEVYKGVCGRLREGLWPWSAPLGYLDMGPRGKVKKVDEEREREILQVFQAFATGEHTYESIRDESIRIGLTTRNGKPLTKTKLQIMLNNPFYMGWMRETKTGLLFEGRHRAIVPPELFAQVQRVIKERLRPPRRVHDYLFRRLITCGYCSHSLVGERQKGHVYYRCHTKGCPTTSIREESASAGVANLLKSVQPHPHWKNKVLADLIRDKAKAAKSMKQRMEGMKLKEKQLHAMREKLLDAYLEGAIDKETYSSKKIGIEAELSQTKEKISRLVDSSAREIENVEKYLELAESLMNTYARADQGSKRRILRFASSNLSVKGRELEAMPAPALATLSRPPDLSKCAHSRYGTRTLANQLLDAIQRMKWYAMENFGYERQP